MNIMVLGASGYLGGNIVHRLLEDGHRVICVVRNSSNTSHIDSLKVDFISNDIDSIKVKLKHSHIDWIINSVCTYGINETLYGDLFMSNIIFPLNVLNLGLKQGVRNYISIGTSLPENFNLYSFTKHKYGEFGKFLCRSENINFADLRPEMFYGGMFEPDNRFIRSCKNKLIEDEPIALTEGIQRRDIIRMDDVVGIISRIIELGYAKGYMKLPIGSGEQHSIREIVEFMKRTLKSQSILEFGKVKPRKDEPDTLADIGWYKEIGYEMQYLYFDGLREECSR